MGTDPDGRDEPHETIGDRTTLEYDVTSDDRTWGILTHAAAFAGFLIPFGNVLGPLLVWAIKKDESRFVDENGKQALNFQITWTILLFVAAVSIVVVIGLVLLPILALAWFVLIIIAIIRASNDEVYEYPFTLDIVS
ncbi:DUF4870 domain-containing protein [Natrialbaceae archaeon AArc-T1-2]|uniref:DUF4870 domain-containing protein n=1 Tax=Natrialbaceae archaeon AArc-T1-2 TaxID=3053904 RepID=UPI00255B1DB0|nr:DUF4870 domain-containing protein [Natrialbaceae archaeon AArc-T1-2]WIV67268.1 DUF4870 domain-containing protein [Natrialbaceae archaeon AArc-T1-2]